MGHIGSTIAILVLATVATGCASAPYPAGTDASTDQPVEPQAKRAFSLERKATGVTHAAWIYTRSVYENPINRPVSHAASLGSLALKSTGGMLRRIAIGTVQMPSLDEAIPEIANADPMDLDAFENTLDHVTGTRRDTGRIRFLVGGDEYFDRLMQAIDEAAESIDIRTYIFDNDDFAIAMADRLKERSRDLRVRIMVDSIGNMLALQADPASLPPGYEHPASMRLYLQSDSNVRIRNMTNPWFTGDHTKTTIIDQRVAFVGGMNIGREYRHDWHDLMMEVSGPVVDQLQFESDKAWARGGLFGDFANALRFIAGKEERADRDGYPLRILQTKNFDSQIHRAQLAAIQNARSYILIENAYFSDDRTIYELAKARRRGVDVRVIIPAKGNHGPLNASNRVTINTLLKHGIRVYEYPGMSHVKAAVFDGWACVGSANFDKLSLEVNKELNLATSDPETVDALIERVFIPDLLASREVRDPVGVVPSTYLAEIIVDELL